MRLYGHTTRHGGSFHQIGIWCLLAADDDRRDATRNHRVDTVLPRSIAAEKADHHHVDTAQEFTELAFDEPGGIRPPIPRHWPGR